MNIPNLNDTVWDNVITQKTDYGFEFLATKILVGRVALKYKRALDPQKTLMDCKRDLRNFFEKNITTPKVQTDLQKILA